MSRSKRKRILVLLILMVPITFWSYSIRRHNEGPVKMADFSSVYFATRCVIHRRDPYDRAAFVKELATDGVSFARAPLIAKSDLNHFASCIYLPSAFLVFVPFALLPWAVAQNLFMIIDAGFLALASYLMWDLGAETAPLISGCMVVFAAVNCMLLLLLGNPAGVAASFCVVAVWCFVKERWAAVGVALLAISLVIKPHDAGFVWLYFLLAGGAMRKRALQTLAVAAVLGVGAAIWIVPASPHWVDGLHRNLEVFSARGGLTDPGPSGSSNRTFAPVIDLQNAVSVFKDDPRFYNPVSYLVAAALILTWIGGVLRKRAQAGGEWLALSAISCLTLLVGYHRSYDAKILLLMIPGCAMLWVRKGATRWVALALTAAAIVATSDLPIIGIVVLTKNLHVSAGTLAGKLMLLLLQPAPLVLLAAGCFYLWAYIQYQAPGAGEAERNAAVVRAAKAAI